MLFIFAKQLQEHLTGKGTTYFWPPKKFYISRQNLFSVSCQPNISRVSRQKQTTPLLFIQSEAYYPCSFASKGIAEKKKMANRKFEFSREGKDLRLSMAQGDVTLARLATAFQVSFICSIPWYVSGESNDIKKELFLVLLWLSAFPR